MYDAITAGPRKTISITTGTGPWYDESKPNEGRFG